MGWTSADCIESSLATQFCKEVGAMLMRTFCGTGSCRDGEGLLRPECDGDP